MQETVCTIFLFGGEAGWQMNRIYNHVQARVKQESVAEKAV
jgi:hypothetical protein